MLGNIDLAERDLLWWHHHWGGRFSFEWPHGVDLISWLTFNVRPPARLIGYWVRMERLWPVGAPRLVGLLNSSTR